MALSKRALILTFLVAGNASDVCTGDDCSDDVLLVQTKIERRSELNGAFETIRDTILEVLHGPQHNIGSEDCRCVGVNGIKGTTNVTVNGPDGKPVIVGFERDMGSRCEAWDDGKHPLCTGASPEAFCKLKWCYVDPCKCNNQIVAPALQVYLPPDSKYNGKPVHYSYVTCDAAIVDPFAPPADASTACGKQATKELCSANANCSWGAAAVAAAETCIQKETAKTCKIQPDEKVTGLNTCPCVGIQGRPGTSELTMDSENTSIYPADTGSHCQAWDGGRHPLCPADAAKPDDWCVKKWCYIDPCNCAQDPPPRPVDYIPDGSFQGKKIYFSYKTCGEKPFEGVRDIPEELKALAGICPAAAAAAPAGAAPVPAAEGANATAAAPAGAAGAEEPKSAASARTTFLAAFAAVVVALRA